jgi:hypothetical protein
MVQQQCVWTLVSYSRYKPGWCESLQMLGNKDIDQTDAGAIDEDITVSCALLDSPILNTALLYSFL